MKALVVDPDPGLRHLLADLLHHHGYTVLMPSDAAQAMKHWRAHTPDIVLLEPVLPQTDGLALCRQLHAATVPVLLVTTRDGDSEVQEGLAAGASDYVIKPFSPRQLIARIALVLRRAGQRAGA